MGDLIAAMEASALRRILSAAPIATLFAHQATGTIVAQNLAFRTLFQYADADLALANAYELSIWDHSQQTLELLRSQLPTTNFEVTLHAKDAAPRIVLLSVEPLQVDGQPHFVAMFVDNSEKIQLASQSQMLRDELAHVLRLRTLGEMAAELAHELNQPLTSIGLYANAARELTDSSSTELTDCLDRIGVLTDHASAIVRRIRTFAGSRQSLRTNQSINQLAQEAIYMIRPEVKANDINLVCKFGEQIPEIRADGVQIQQVLVNLIRNAIEAMKDVDPGQRSLLVRTELLGDMACVRITDSGNGIDPTIVEQLFQPFLTTKRDGLGLGLRICNTLIASHGGKLDFYANKTAGATFYFVLPTVAGASLNLS
jgi:two-component system, LuxR family, sensor kinase FixL